MSAPRNTSHDVLFTGGPARPSDVGAILAQEKDGQTSFVNSDTLPSQMSAEARLGLETAGVVFGDPVPGDDLFIYVTLPEGWRKSRTSHSMHSDLLDEKGRKRAGIFYKAAFYDRRADLHIVSRFSVRQDYDAADGTVVYCVVDNGETVFTTDPIAYKGEKYGRHHEKAQKKASAACESWLERNGFPEWRNPGMYWD